MGDRDGRRLSTCVTCSVHPGKQLWGKEEAAAPQYLCRNGGDGTQQTCCGAVQEDERQQALSNWKKGLNSRGLDCIPQDESQATKQ